MNLADLTPHAHRVHAFMLRGRQTTPTVPTVPDAKTRLLRAKLILEEALETINALGMTAACKYGQTLYEIKPDQVYFAETHEPNLVEIVDGCADVSVVTVGTLLACGVEDRPVLELVDANNLGKFGPGSSIRDDGKVMKPPGFVGPNIEAELRRQGWGPRS